MEAESDSVVESFDDSASHISKITIGSDSSSCSPQEADFIDGEDWVKFDEELDSDIPKTLEEMQQELDEMVFPEEEQTLWEIRNNILTDADRDNVRAFKLQLASGMSRSAFAQMRYAFRHQLEISSHWAMIHRIAILARVQSDWYNCCPHSCLAYTGHYADLTHCCFCAEPRFTPTNKPRRLFCYLPVIPRLQAFFSNPKKIDSLLYRHNYKHRPDEISDVFDGLHYRNLCRTKVTVDGRELPHCYFSGKYDVSLGICLDSYLLFDRKRK
ncbi:hypothetical protein DFH07DRAFT_896229, partial [Mycena maculata]